jgi:hypothetical protein
MSLVVHRTPLSRVASDHLPLVAEVALPPAMPSDSNEDEEDLALEEAR